VTIHFDSCPKTEDSEERLRLPEWSPLSLLSGPLPALPAFSDRCLRPLLSGLKGISHKIHRIGWADIHMPPGPPAAAARSLGSSLLAPVLGRTSY